MLCLVTCIRNAEISLRKWVNYHISAGITHFYIADHQPSRDSTSSILASLQEAYPDNFKVVVCHGAYRQSLWTKELANMALQDAGTSPVALFFHDSDEYVAGNGAPLPQRARECFDLLDGGPPYPFWRRPGASGAALLFVTPPCNAVPPALGEGDGDRWTESRLAVPGSLEGGKSSLFVGSGRASTLVVADGCCHRVRTLPPISSCVCPDQKSGDYVWPLPPEIFPTVYSHNCYMGPEHLWVRIGHFIETGLSANMQRRYGSKQGFSGEQVREFAEWVQSASPSEAKERALRLYRREIFSCLHLRCVKMDHVARYFHGEDEGFDVAKETAMARKKLSVRRTHEGSQHHISAWSLYPEGKTRAALDTEAVLSEGVH